MSKTNRKHHKRPNPSPKGVETVQSLPPPLVSAIREQSAVLFLGAGANDGATHPHGAAIPTATALRDNLSDRFLGGKLKTRPLSHVAEMCISQTDLTAVQSFIRDQLEAFEPADYHLLIPEFYWHALVTTNYDLIIETAYTRLQNPKQTLVAFVKDGQRIDTTLKQTSNGLRYIKLHGSIDQIHDSDIPLILAKEQYIRYQKNRTRLFSSLRQIGHEYPIIFCGYSIDDPHIQELLFDLSDLSLTRPRYYIVSPDLDEIEQNYWESHRITCVKCTFEQFLHSLAHSIPELQRSIPRSLGGGTESVRTFYRIAGASESESLRLFLATDVDHVRSNLATDAKGATQFYRGGDSGWGPIESKLDVPRRITDNVIVDAVLTDEAERQQVVDLHLIKGPAGHGKSTTLRRIAWEAAITYSKLCLFVREEGAVKIDPLIELSNLCGKRIFLFVDRAAIRSDEIHRVIRRFRQDQIPLTIVTAERDNEWNVRCDTLDEFLTQEYHLRNLSETEIHALLKNLEAHGSLGRLIDLSYDDRVREFLERAERQILVALHEATLGKPFEEIVKDEFDRIIPREAQTLYLDICTLNRLGVPVRAGLISRVSGIRFDEFQDRFLAPLEHVVKSHIDPYVGDRMYSARHSHIADLVFQQVLTDPENRFDQIVRIFDGMNIDYSSDSEAFRSLIRGRSIAAIFPSAELARKLYDRVDKLVPDHPQALQQRAIFEMSHDGGNLQRAERSIMKAVHAAPHNRSIQHTVANLKRQQANSTTNALLREKLRKDSMRYLDRHRSGEFETSYEYHTYTLVLLDDLEDSVDNSDDASLDPLKEKTLVDLVRNIESTLRQGQQKFPEEERLLMAESRFRDLLSQSERALLAIQRAFQKNPRSEWVAIRLSRRLIETSEYSEARNVLRKCLEENPGSKAVNFALAKFYMHYGDDQDGVQILDLLRRSFSQGDTQWDAQYWYARELFLRGQFENSDSMFRILGALPVRPKDRNRIRGWILDSGGKVKRFRSRIEKKEETYLFTTAEGLGPKVFCHSSQASDELWRTLSVGDAINLEVGFSMRGLSARIAE